MSGEPVSHRIIEKDARVLDPGALYHGGILVATAGGTATVTVYDGINTSGEVIDYFSAASSGRDPRWLGEGVRLTRGLYVDIGSNVSKFTIYYTPTPREKG